MKFPIMSEIKANEPVCNICNSVETLVDTFYYKESQKRFKTLFLFLIKNVGIYTKFGIIITYSLSHQDIADIIGSNRITITRIINNLNRKKIISIYKRRFILHDPLLLVQLT
uniref:Global nitrogen transcriptional regulator n=1 Tax=Porphyridium purpureum TaxID=35688 RepID=W0RYH0_PORPP|nr:global nitrogen transcriptional regulator [Porphyridium purpureum]BAO23689.1 global nitrogen transcriptional regulator [Porphyridium purpureum]